MFKLSVASVKKDLDALGTTGQEEILNYLEEVIVLGSFATEVKENRFSKGKVCPTVGMRKYQEMASSIANKDISVSPAERPLLILHVHPVTTVRKILKSGYYILNV